MSEHGIWSNGRLLQYGNYHPYFQGKTLDVYKEVKEPKNGDYGVFSGPWNSSELRSLFFTKRGKLNGGQKRHARYFLRKIGTEYFPTYSEKVQLCFVIFSYQSLVADNLPCYDFFSVEKNVLSTLKELKTLCADFGVNVKYDAVRTQRNFYVHFFRNIEHCERRTFWKVANVDIDSWLKGLHSFFPVIQEIVRQGLIDREIEL